MHEFYPMCDDLKALVAELKKRDITCGAVENQGWGLLTHVTLPGGGKLGIYEPRHARPKPVAAAPARTQSKPKVMKRKQRS